MCELRVTGEAQERIGGGAGAVMTTVTRVDCQVELCETKIAKIMSIYLSQFPPYSKFYLMTT